MPPPEPRLILLPTSAFDVARIAERAIRAAGAAGKLPTPTEDLIRAAKITEETDVDGLVERFLSTLDEGGRKLLRASMQKLRGIADMRERVVYVPSDKAPRERFAKSHELGHQLLPWHHLKNEEPVNFYHDDNHTLSPEVRDLFETEANYFAAEVIFQGQRFAAMARDFAPSFDAVFHLADLHGASTQATLRRYIEAQDEVIAAVEYLPNSFRTDEDGETVLHKPRWFGSCRFVQKYGDVRLPTTVTSGHPWAGARKPLPEMEGEIDLDCGGQTVRFQWQSWWNSYALMVLLRRRPALSTLGRLIRSRSKASAGGEGVERIRL